MRCRKGRPTRAQLFATDNPTDNTRAWSGATGDTYILCRCPRSVKFDPWHASIRLIAPILHSIVLVIDAVASPSVTAVMSASWRLDVGRPSRPDHDVRLIRHLVVAVLALP